MKSSTDTSLVAEQWIAIPSLQKRDLGDQWKFRKYGEDAWTQVCVPGTNFGDLYRSKVIPDPFFGDGEAKLQWIELEDWEYLCEFELKDSMAASIVDLVFEGLDTYCDVYLNEHHLLQSNNMFVGHRVTCTDHLIRGVNELRILFRSPIRQTMDLHKKMGFTYPAENDKTKESLSVFTRKAPYHYGWDWGPKFVTSGIWRPVYLEVYQGARLEEIQIHQNWVDDQNVELSFIIELSGKVPDGTCIHIKSPNHEELVVEPVHIRNSHVETPIHISKPRKWWPNGLGEAHLYEFEVSAVLKGKTMDSRLEKIGLRTIEVVNEADDQGESFYIKVNGHPVFMKGANYIPSDSFLPDVSAKKYKQIFQDAVAANMNMLRVWGGGTYENDLFYDLADQYGILIWQDFMFSCTLYPANDEFLENVRAEAIYNIKRLRNHPCIALWCGNNEVEMGSAFWEWKEKFNYSDKTWEMLQADYAVLFKNLLPTIVKAFDPARFYFSSSPIGFWENPEDDKRGDNHYWGVWHGEEDFDEFKRRIPRFMSEYGFQSFPAKQSMEKFLDSADMHLESAALSTHQKHPRGNRIIRETIERYYNKPTNFEEFLYLSQLVQAEGLKIAFEAHRKSMPYCMGTLYWQFNDCWPAISWSGIDYYGTWKALHYQAKRSFSTDILVIEEENDELKIHVVSDRLEAFDATLEIKILDFNGSVEQSLTSMVSISGNESVLVLTTPVSELINKASQDQVFLRASLKGEKISEQHANYYFSKARDLQLPSAQVKHELRKEGDNLTITLGSDVLVKNLYVFIEEISGNFDDNFFDLIPGQKKVVSMETSANPNEGQVKFLHINPSAE